jgi:hypothetical protein
MSENQLRPVQVAILAYPEVTASVVYGLYDLFMSAGRDWGILVDGVPGPSVMKAQVVSRISGPFAAANGARSRHYADCALPDVVRARSRCRPASLSTPSRGKSTG